MVTRRIPGDRYGLATAQRTKARQSPGMASIGKMNPIAPVEIDTSRKGHVAAIATMIRTSALTRSNLGARLKNDHQTMSARPPATAPITPNGVNSGTKIGTTNLTSHCSITMATPGHNLRGFARLECILGLDASRERFVQQISIYVRCASHLFLRLNRDLLDDRGSEGPGYAAIRTHGRRRVRSFVFSGEPGGNRTPNPQIKSRRRPNQIRQRKLSNFEDRSADGGVSRGEYGILDASAQEALSAPHTRANSGCGGVQPPVFALVERGSVNRR